MSQNGLTRKIDHLRSHSPRLYKAVYIFFRLLTCVEAKPPWAFLWLTSHFMMGRASVTRLRITYVISMYDVISMSTLIAWCIHGASVAGSGTSIAQYFMSSVNEEKENVLSDVCSME
jgi:hypothetical protein